MEGVEASGKTVDEAIEKALDELDADRDEVEVEVLSEGKGGVLGVGGSEARVRVTLLDEADDDEDDDAEEEEDADEDDGQAAGAEEGASDEPDGEGGEDAEEEDEAEKAAQMLDRLLELMHVRADVSIRDPETPGDGLGMAIAVLEIEGDDLGLLIGRRGETLQALQYLLNLMVTRELGQNLFFTVDVEGYRRRRERALMSLAKRTADQVKRTRRPMTLDPMPANERRIIHLTLSEDRYVSTASVGEGEDRKVNITPKAPRI
jgi:spoIIIJ-associated protein